MDAAKGPETGGHVRVHRVFIPKLQAGETTLTGSEAQHLAQVLRAQPGARVRAFDGAGREADGLVYKVDAFQVTVQLGPSQPSTVEASLDITLAVALLKGDKLSEVVRRGTELGVARFVLFVGERSDVRALSANKLERLRRVAQEAAKQSGRSVVPEVSVIAKLEALGLGGLCLVAEPRAEKTLRHLGELTRPVTVITGPEGGLSDAEMTNLTVRGAYRVRLGARILRAETAPIAVAAALLVPEAL